ncbi:NYN domain-containing protein [Microlunatus elymi]|uniref:NYN domain-containing protein n=1 Tax=Microlunatus elymi TaxID=2596828 RepID=A0A516PYQ3_9ACTN|nr:NYN domain-containing protein [Microlunatus elymi]QDP96306.1 NYN domain-containing protein [Microlunatus elymi]
MRSRCALYVDAGYLLAAAATRLTGTSLRSGITVDYPKLISNLIQQVETQSGLPLLRANWYDSARHALPDPEQERIAMLPRVKLRLGRIGYAGEQKGVDLRLGLDLITHARNGAVEVMFLISGDDDLSEAVEEAQLHGVQVIIVGVPDSNGLPHGVSRHLRRAADDLVLLDAELITSAIGRAVAPTVPAPVPIESNQHKNHNAPSPALLAGVHRSDGVAPATGTAAVTPSAPVGGRSSATLAYRTDSEHPRHPDDDGKDAAEVIDGVARRVLHTWLSSATSDQRRTLLAGRPSIPRDIDKALLIDLSDALGEYDLSDARRFALRERFWHQVAESDAFEAAKSERVGEAATGS